MLCLSFNLNCHILASGFPPVILESIGIFSYINLAIWDRKLFCKKIIVYTSADVAAGMASGICFSFSFFFFFLQWSLHRIHLPWNAATAGADLTLWYTSSNSAFSCKKKKKKRESKFIHWLIFYDYFKLQ